MHYTVYAKQIESFLFYYSGLTRLLSNFYRDSIILAYHHVLPHDDEMIKFIQPGMYVTVNTFEKHLQYLSKHYTLIPLDQLIRYPDVKNTCTITFDDGWTDNYIHAYPILKKYGIPATIFLTTNKIGSDQWPWPDKISYYIHSASGAQISELFRMARNLFDKTNRPLDNKIASLTNRFTLADRLISSIKTLGIL